MIQTETFNTLKTLIIGEGLAEAVVLRVSLAKSGRKEKVP
jgi:hypothetical protein